MLPIQTSRLSLRELRGSDVSRLAGLCADPEVMRYFPRALNASESASLASRIQSDLTEYGYSALVVERLADKQFLGIVGLSFIAEGFDFAPCTEVMWRLTKHAWGHGYATEAASASLQYGFETLGLDKIIAMTAVRNTPSKRVMLKLGMSQACKFMHPKLTPTDPLCEHVLYEIRAGDLSGTTESQRST